MKHEVIIQNNKLLVSTSALCEFFNVKAPTITGWTKKWLKATAVPGEKKNYYDLFETINLKQLHLNEKHSKSKSNDEVTPDDITLKDGRTLAEVDVNNPRDLEMLAIHPMGERFMGIVKSAEDISKKKHELAVKKRQYIETHELDRLLSEFLAQIKNKLISIRDQLPIEQADKIIELEYADKNAKKAIQQVLSDAADKDFLEMLDDIHKTMFTRTSENNEKAIKFLKNLIKRIEDEHTD